MHYEIVGIHYFSNVYTLYITEYYTETLYITEIVNAHYFGSDLLITTAVVKFHYFTFREYTYINRLFDRYIFV